MLDPEKLRKISEGVSKRQEARRKRSAQKAKEDQLDRAKREFKKLVPKAEQKVIGAAKKGLDKVAVFNYRDQFGSLQNEVARLITGHFDKKFTVTKLVDEEEGCYFGTHIVVHIR